MLSKNWVAMGGWLPFLLLASLLSTSLTVISPGTQAKIGVSIETANVFLAEAKGHLQSQADSLKALKKLGVRRKAYEFRKYTKLVGKVSAMLSAVSGFAAIFSVVSTFFMPSQLEVIQENFDKVNKKLDGLSTQMNSVKNELKSSIEFNSWITAYVDWELDIRHGDDKLNEMKNRLRNTDNERDRLKLFETYVNHFEAQNIDGKSDKVYHLTALESTTTKNLFQLFREEKGCDIFQLSQFMSVIQITMTSAATQSAIYEFLKHGEIDYVQKRIMLYYKKLYEIRHRFDSEIWYCYRDYKATMDSEVTKIVMDNKQSSQETLTYKLHERLSGLMPWYGWAVVAYNKDEPSSTNSECFNAKGSHQYTIFNKVANTDNKNFIVVWQDIDDRSNGCRDLEDAQVFISFQYCSGCNSDAVRASDNIITGKECMDYYKTITLECISPLQEEKPNTSFIAASFSSSQNPCETSNMCNSHGICKHIPSTRNALCLCNEYYEGDKCEKFINPATGNKIIEMLSSLRLEFAQFSGLPTVIDVYLSIQEIPKQLELMRQRLTSSIKFSQILTLFGQDFTDAEYILVTYKTFQTGLIDEQTFSDRLSKLNMHRIQNGIKSAILGSSFLLSGDFMTVYKKSIIAEEGDNFACTSQYSKLVSLLRNNLVLIDQSLSEVKLWNSYGNSQKLTEENQDQNILTNAENELKASKERKIMYKKFWSSTSCPKLNSLELKEHFCEDYHSYEGLQVPLSCDNEKFPTPGSVTCSKNGVELKWSSSPVCLYQWSSWSSWSSCSMTCGGGISTRRRTKPNGDVDVDTSQINCNKEHCCQHQLVILSFTLFLLLNLLIMLNDSPIGISVNHATRNT